MKKIIYSFLVSSCFISFAHPALSMPFTQTTTTPIQVHSASLPLSATPSYKQVTLLKVQLPEEQFKNLQTNLQHPKIFSASPIISNMPTQINLGMNHVPVLDQGAHGSCVTFATTAVMDAALGKGDYLSQLCSLELGTYLENKSDMPSGWEGSFGPWVFDQILRFGVVSKETQETQSCAGVKKYPINSPLNEGKPLSIDGYKKLSQPINNKLFSLDLLNAFNRKNHIGDVTEGDAVLQQVKKTLTEKNRIAFGSLLVLTPKCEAGACASYHVKDDTWALTSDISRPSSDDLAGHEMIITGYDDNAIAVDHQGLKHQGLLFLRNSWGEEAGDKGNFYMTYDYFKIFVDEAQAIEKIVSR